jgi:hypothetical protein
MYPYITRHVSIREQSLVYSNVELIKEHTCQ